MYHVDLIYLYLYIHPPGVIVKSPYDLNSTCNATAKFTCTAMNTNLFLWMANNTFVLVLPDDIIPCDIQTNVTKNPAESNITFCIPDNDTITKLLDDSLILCRAFWNDITQGTITFQANSSKALLRIQGN